MGRRSSGLGWICATVAPWALAAGLLVSFTAVASNDPLAGFSAAPAYRALLDVPIVPGIDGMLASPATRLRPQSVAAAPEMALRAEMKRDAGAAPVVARSRKGAAAGRLLASFSRRGLDLAKGDTSGTDARVLFLHDEGVLPPTVLMPGPVAGPDWESARGLEPWTDDSTATRGASSVQSPAAAAAGSTGAARGSNHNGATPSVSRAASLSSTTPAAADAVPLEIAAAPVSPLLAPGAGGSTAIARAEPESRPRYADLIAPGAIDREQRCLAEAVYFEARSESEAGRAAVAQVILNRVRSGLYPSSVCGVVYQNRHRHLACQFTFACEGKALRITDGESWDAARRIAKDVTEGRTYLAEVGGSTHYHADYVRPGWARRLKKMDVIGRHIFYQLRPGQT
jgi:spore germination cell wall hydrolase CwlJ-like protein